MKFSLLDKHRTQALNVVMIISFILYMAVLLSLIIFKQRNIGYMLSHRNEYHLDWNSINLIPFHFIKDIVRSFGEYYSRFVYRNIYGNILAFMPLGFYLSMFFKEYSIKKVTIVGMMLSILFEVFQGVTMTGLMDIDDVILNSLGTAIGYIVYIVCKKLWSVSIREGTRGDLYATKEK